MSANFQDIPVITIDGPGGVGKGTISAMLAAKLNWHYLDSGAMFRITAYASIQQKIAENSPEQLAQLARSLKIHFSSQGNVYLDEQDISTAIRTEETARIASKIAVHQALREVLLDKQQAFLKEPGLVADGRDMGTTVFPFSKCKFYLAASAEERARRRYKQLIDKETSAKIRGFSESSELSEIITQIKARDERDMNRISSPLKPADDAHLIDTTHLSIDEVFQQVLSLSVQAIDSLK